MAYCCVFVPTPSLIVPFFKFFNFFESITNLKVNVFKSEIFFPRSVSRGGCDSFHVKEDKFPFLSILGPLPLLGGVKNMLKGNIKKDKKDNHLNWSHQFKT